MTGHIFLHLQNHHTFPLEERLVNLEESALFVYLYYGIILCLECFPVFFLYFTLIEQGIWLWAEYDNLPIWYVWEFGMYENLVCMRIWYVWEFGMYENLVYMKILYVLYENLVWMRIWYVWEFGIGKCLDTFALKWTQSELRVWMHHTLEPETLGRPLVALQGKHYDPS